VKDFRISKSTKIDSLTRNSHGPSAALRPCRFGTHPRMLGTGPVAIPQRAKRRFRMSFQIPSGVPNNGYPKLPRPSGDYLLLRFDLPGWQRTVGWLINRKVRGRLAEPVCYDDPWLSHAISEHRVLLIKNHDRLKIDSGCALATAEIGGFAWVCVV